MRRVAYLTPLRFDPESYLGGGERYPLNLAKAVVLASEGRYQVELVSYGPREEQLPLADGVTLRVLRAAWKPKEGVDVVSWDVLDAVRGADLVHVHQVLTRSGETGVLAAKLRGLPVVVSDHGAPTSRLGESLGMLDLVDRITAYSDFGASLLRSGTAIEVVKGGVDDRSFTPPDEPRERDRVVYVGRLLPHKGVDRLIEALPAGLRLTVCGQPYDREYRELLARVAEGREVAFVEDADDEALRELYRRALAVVLPSTYVDCYGRTHVAPELMGLSLLEGMACGAPAVCSRVGGAPEFVEHGATGFVFDSVDELTEQLERLAAEPELVHRLGAAGRARVESDYGLGPVGARMLACYEDVLWAADAAAAMP